MGKTLSLAMGFLILLGGLALLFVWGNEFFIMLKGAVPLFLIFIGFIALAAGFSELRDIRKMKDVK